MGDWSGTVPTILAGDVVTGTDWNNVLGELTAISSAWAEFGSVAWTASSVNPAIGNGTLTAHYTRVGSLLLYKGAIVMGSTTTFGTGYWILSIPYAITGSNRNVGVAGLHDASLTTNDRAGALEVLSSTTFRVTADGRLDATTPFTWASGDILQWFLCAEVA